MKQKLVRKFDFKSFKSISHAISTYEDLNLLIQAIAEGTTRSFDAKGCSIMLYDDREKQLFHLGGYGISDAYLKKGPVLVENKYSAFVKGEPVFVEDMQTDPRVQYPEEAAKEGIVSMLSVPIKSRETVIGIIRLYEKEPWALHEDDIDAMCVLCEQLGLVIENNGLRNFFEQVKMALASLPQRMLEGL